MLKKELLHIIQYALYFLGAAFVFELAQGTRAWIKTVLGVTLLLLSMLQSIPFWSLHFLRRLIAKLNSDVKLDLTAAHMRKAPGDIEELLKKELSMKSAKPLALYLCELPEKKLYELLEL